MTQPNYTERCDGNEMVDIRVTIQISREDVVRLASDAQVSEAKALEMYRKRLASEARLAYAYNRFVLNEDSGGVEWLAI